MPTRREDIEKVKTKLVIIIIYIMVVILAVLFLNVCAFIPGIWLAYFFTTVLPFCPVIVRYLFGAKNFDINNEQLIKQRNSNLYKISFILTNLLFIAVSVVAIIEIPYSFIELIKR